MISSCGHCGLINTIKAAMAVANVDKLHAVLGGFHLGVAREMPDKLVLSNTGSRFTFGV